MRYNTCFATIVTSSYMGYAQALCHSIRQFHNDIPVVVLVVDSDKLTNTSVGFDPLFIKDLAETPLANELFLKYGLDHPDYLRWSLKPVLISYLLSNRFEKVVYVDCDIHFFSNCDFLFDLLDRYSVLLTSHWYDTVPQRGKEGFEQMLRNGFFNAGFIGCNKNGLLAMRWWSQACYNEMGIVKEKGIYVDQRYLDYLPLLFEGIKVLDQRGCNVGARTGNLCVREEVNGEILIDGIYPIVFIHFNAPLVEEINRGFDPLLVPFWKTYIKTLSQYGVRYSKNIHVMGPLFVHKIKWRLRIRTRFKKLLHSIADKL